jgi:acyl-CoA thioesterase-1
MWKILPCSECRRAVTSPARLWGYVFTYMFPRVLAAIVVIIVAVSRLSPVMAGENSLRILALGDSLTAGYGLGPRAAFPAQLEAALRKRGHAITVINAGVSGDTSAGGRSRIDWALGATPPPDVAIVALGANDGLRGIEPAVMHDNLDAILKALRGAKVPALIAGMKAPRNFGPGYMQEFEAIFPSLAAKYNALHHPFFLDGVALDPMLNQGDGLHPNERGVQKMVTGIMPLVERLLIRVERKGAL